MTAFTPGNHQPAIAQTTDPDNPMHVVGRVQGILVSIPAVVPAPTIAHHDYNWVGALNSARGFVGNSFSWLIHYASTPAVLITALALLVTGCIVLGRMLGGRR